MERLMDAPRDTRNLWQRLTTPAEKYRNPDRKRRARMLNSLLLLLVPLFSLPVIIRPLFVISTELLIYFMVAFTVLVIAYIISRAGQYRIAAMLTFGVFTVNPVIILLLQGNYSPENISNTIFWIVPTIVLGSLVLSLRSTLLLIVGNMALMLAFVKVAPGLNMWQVALPLGFAFVISILIVAVMLLRLQDLRKIEEQSSALGESEERFRSLFEATFEGIAVHEGGFIVDANPAFQKMFGYSEDEVLSRALWEFCDETSREVVQEKIHAESEETFEAIGLKKDGSTFVLELMNKGHQYRGERVLVTALRDITERKQAEEAREKLIQELDAFAHTVAHDLKNPMNLVLGYYHMIAEDYRSLPEKDFEMFLESMGSGVHKMVNIIDELLVLASARSTEVESKPLDMTQIIFESHKRLDSLIHQYNPEMIVPLTWPAAAGHAPWVEEVWTNYISNAIKYGGNPPRVELGATPLEDGMVRFWVKDNGPGVPPEQHDILFIPFTRLSQVRAEGHGLGLSIVQRIVEKLGGEVGLESEMGKGSTFYFTLPAVK
jgi:PAS domain S-box-containing protein